MYEYQYVNLIMVTSSIITTKPFDMFFSCIIDDKSTLYRAMFISDEVYGSIYLPILKYHLARAHFTKTD